MSACHYTNSTLYAFHNELNEVCDNTNYVGVAEPDEIENALTCMPLTDKWVQFFVSKIVDIPSMKPSAEGIVSVNSCVEIISQRVIKTPTVTGYTNSAGVLIPGITIGNAECSLLTGRKLIIEGTITQKIIYTALLEEQPLHSATFIYPFSTFIILDPDTPLSMEFRIYPYLEDVFVGKLSDRSFFTNNTLFIKAASIC